jgi:hypothetical protein
MPTGERDTLPDLPSFALDREGEDEMRALSDLSTEVPWMIMSGLKDKSRRRGARDRSVAELIKCEWNIRRL